MPRAFPLCEAAETHPRGRLHDWRLDNLPVLDIPRILFGPFLATALAQILAVRPRAALLPYTHADFRHPSRSS